jgi:hypothetical protein
MLARHGKVIAAVIVVGTRLEGVTVDPTAIQWLKLAAVSSQGQVSLPALPLSSG